MSADDRSVVIEWLRSELVGPMLESQYGENIRTVSLVDSALSAGADEERWRPVFHRAGENDSRQEILTGFRDTPRRRYVAGLLYPDGSITDTISPIASPSDDEECGEYMDEDEDENEPVIAGDGGNDGEENDTGDTATERGLNIRIENGGSNRRRPSTLGISFFAEVPPLASLRIRLPAAKHFSWQNGGREFPVNGWYRKVRYIQTDGSERDAWARQSLAGAEHEVTLAGTQLQDRRKMTIPIEPAGDCPLRLQFEVFPRRMSRTKIDDRWLFTVVLRNVTPDGGDVPEQSRILFQSLFEVFVDGGRLLPYPESKVDPSLRDSDEQTLSLLYQDFATWGIGHRCSAAWDSEPGVIPEKLTADVMPTVETASMTPDLVDRSGVRLVFSMSDLAGVPEWQSGQAQDAWDKLQNLVTGYGAWCDRLAQSAAGLAEHHQKTAMRHIAECLRVRARMQAGLDLLKKDKTVLEALRLANKAMLLQQIATKKLSRRLLAYDAATRSVLPNGPYTSPVSLLETGPPLTGVGTWRAFQIAFLLMSLEGCVRDESPEKAIVDLIWFPTGGGKTEAYLAVAAFYMFHERLRQHQDGEDALPRDGTNVLMRYTLRLLTTQQFQRAASLLCAMEYLRTDALKKNDTRLGQTSFALGLWIGNESTPGSNEAATNEIADYRRRGGGPNGRGNPLVLTECPWCRAEIGAYVYPNGVPAGFTRARWNQTRVRGIVEVNGTWRLRCPTAECAYGGNSNIPVHVIDDNIYHFRPSMVIGTVDKFAQLAFKSEARSLFGLARRNNSVERVAGPPGLILQDELHLISGPLGSVFGLYEAAIEDLCTSQHAPAVRPKIICSTATIRGAAEQVLSIFGRTHVCLFPSPGLHIGDSYFGVFARRNDGRLDHGRMYLGVHADNAASFATAQVRTFARFMQAVSAGVVDETLPGTQANRRDPWWTLLLFFNSIRELGQAGTLWQGDIPGRLRYLSKRDGYDVRYIQRDAELSGRLDQDDLVKKLDDLAVPYQGPHSAPKPLDVVRASNIIEVGVDVDRLSVLGVAGQPKTTAQYIQVTGRVGRRWNERPGLILMIYDAMKARDRSHYENFHGYHRRLYEQVEPTSATPFAAAAIDRALSGALLSCIRQKTPHEGALGFAAHSSEFSSAVDLIRSRCGTSERVDTEHALESIGRAAAEIERVWRLSGHDAWHKWSLAEDDRPLMRSYEQYVTALQRRMAFPTPTSMRQVDRQGEFTITQIETALEQ